MRIENAETKELPPEDLELFQNMILQFQTRADRLSNAYDAMREDFKKVNIELDRKNAELASSLAQIGQMQTYMSSILESMDNGVVGIDLNGTITQFNRAAAQITGFSSEMVLQKSYREIFGKDDSEPKLLKVLREQKPLVHDEKVIWCKDGHPVPVSFQAASLTDQNGHVIGAVEIFSDISKIKALEDEMQQAKTMAALGEMSATVAHEIRNPLGAMGMWAGLLERDLGTEDPRRKTLGKIIEGLGRLNKIVTNLLVYTRPVKAELRKVNLSVLLDEIVDFVSIEIERLGSSVIVNKDFGTTSEAHNVLIDPEKMSQVTMNLCLNALQAMPDGGDLTVRIEQSKDKSNRYICFAIIDTGSGIDRENLGKIFDPFFTTKENGTGLGLAIVKKFVEYHSGHIDVRSVPGEGTSIRVFLPGLKE